MMAEFNIDYNEFKDGNILVFENGKVVSVSKEDFLKSELKDINKIKDDNTYLKSIIEKQNKIIDELETKFKKVMEVFIK